MATTAGRVSRRVQTERTEVSLSDFEKELIKLQGDFEHWNGMIYGDSNVGKTVLAGTLPGRTFWLIGEPGYRSAANRGATGAGRRLTSSAIAWAAIEWLEYKERYRRYDWLILDGITTLDNRFRLGYANEAFDIDPSKRQHRNLPDRPDYFNTQNFWKAYIPRLIDMPVNLLITGHAFRTDKLMEADLYVYPGIQGKVTEVANAISGLLDFVGFMEIHVLKDDNRRNEFHNKVLWQRTTRKNGVTIYAGDKTGKLGRGMIDPTFPKILEKLNGNEEEA